MSSTFAELTIGVTLLAACGSGAATDVEAPATVPTTTTATAQEPPPPEGWLVEVTVVSAEIEGLMPNGDQWDDKGGKTEGDPEATLTAYLARHPELAGTEKMIGIPIEAEDRGKHAKDSTAVDPMVVLEVGGVVFRTPMRPREFSPVWSFPVRFVVGELAALRGVPTDESVKIHVVDYDGPRQFDAIGTTLVPVRELIGKPTHRIGPFGSVKSLALEVKLLPTPANDAEPSAMRLAVPSSHSWTDTGIDIVAGQRVTVDAADEVCTKGDSVQHCSGPEGQRVTSGSNVKGFEKLGHGALVAAVGDTRFGVGRKATFVAPSSGRLYLGINDKDVGNNKGSYAVRVVIEVLPE
jgi:hypothetical protein